MEGTLSRVVRRSCSASVRRADTFWRSSSSRTNSRASPRQPSISITAKPPSTKALLRHLARMVSVDWATFRISG